MQWKVAFRRLHRYAREMALLKDEAVSLIERLRETAEFAVHCMEQNLDGNVLFSAPPGNDQLIWGCLLYRKSHSRGIPKSGRVYDETCYCEK